MAEVNYYILVAVKSRVMAVSIAIFVGGGQVFLIEEGRRMQAVELESVFIREIYIYETSGRSDFEEQTLAAGGEVLLTKRRQNLKGLI